MAHRKHPLGLLLDIGRKHWSLEELVSLLALMADKQFSFLQLHFSENSGFRIESKKYPELASAEHLTYEDIKTLLVEAEKRGIELIPDLDSPGHLHYLLHQYPAFALKKITAEQKLEVTNALDITNPLGVALIFDLYQEYLALFSSSRYFMIGADEFIDCHQIENYPQLIKTARERYGSTASGWEVYIDYVNQLVGLINDEGKTARIWNDGFFRQNQPSLVPLTKQLEVCYWTRWDQSMASINQWLEQGYSLINFNDNYLYFVLGEKAGYQYPSAKKISEEWSPYVFSSNQVVSQHKRNQIIGSYLAVWADQEEALTCQEVLKRLPPLMEAMKKSLAVESE